LQKTAVLYQGTALAVPLSLAYWEL
jgi:hypothetical protein